MSNATLFLSKKDKPVTSDMLEALPDPQPMGNWHKPYRYDEIVKTLIDSVQERGYEVVKNEMAMKEGDKLLLGVMQLRHENQPERSIADTDLRSDIALGYRGSHAQVSSLRVVAGETVFVCSNLLMAAKMIVVCRKFTNRMNLKTTINNGLNMFAVQHRELDIKVGMMSRMDISDSDAKAIIFDSITKDKLPMGVARDVGQWYFGEEYGGPKELPEDTSPRTMFGLHNAFTRSLRELSAQPRFEHTKKVGRIFGL